MTCKKGSGVSIEKARWQLFLALATVIHYEKADDAMKALEIFIDVKIQQAINKTIDQLQANESIPT